MKADFYKNKANVDQYINMAEGHNGALIIDALKPFLSSNSSILEIGSGPGADWEILNREYQVTGSDFSEEFLSILRKKYPKGKFLNLDALTLQTTATFDAIYSNKVLHHLSDKELMMSIAIQHRILNENGLLCHSFWQGEGTENYEGMFVNKHSIEALTSMFSTYFEILLMKEYQEFDSNDSIYIIAKKQ